MMMHGLTNPKFKDDTMLLWLCVLPTERVWFVCNSEDKSYQFPIEQEVTGVYKQGGVFTALYKMGR